MENSNVKKIYLESCSTWCINGHTKVHTDNTYISPKILNRKVKAQFISLSYEKYQSWNYFHEIAFTYSSIQSL